MIGIVLLAWSLTRPKPVAHPLAIAPAGIGAVLIDDEATTASAASAAAALPQKLAASRPIPSPAWIEPHSLRLTLRSGVVLRMQVMREGTDVLLRVTADLPANPTVTQIAQAKRIRALRFNAWRLPAESIAAILPPTDLSTGTETDRGNNDGRAPPMERTEIRQKPRLTNEIP